MVEEEDIPQPIATETDIDVNKRQGSKCGPKTLDDAIKHAIKNLDGTIDPGLLDEISEKRARELKTDHMYTEALQYVQFYNG